MIFTRLTGGIGNQMFQYAAGRSLAARLGTDLKLDARWFQGVGSGIPGSARRYELGCFRVDAELVPATRVARLPPRSRREYWFRRVFPRRSLPFLIPLIEKDGPSADLRFFQALDNTYLDGFWHSERYFEEHADVVRRNLAFSTPPTGRNVELAAKIQDCVSVSVHVRRGDYVVPGETRDVAGVLDENWYRRAVDLVAERVGEVAVYVFSDEPEWCRENLRFDHPATVVTGNGGEASFEDLRLMSTCRHHVIANSTFSWWGAWLNAHPDKIVVAPEPWRMDRAAQDVYPRGSIRLPR